jgi:hypothetical protein
MKLFLSPVSKRGMGRYAKSKRRGRKQTENAEYLTPTEADETFVPSFIDEFCSEHATDWRCAPATSEERLELYKQTVCRRCGPEETTDTIGLYVRYDKSCDLNNLDPTTYFLVPRTEWASQPLTCAEASLGYGAQYGFPDEATFCYEDATAYLAANNENDCLDQAYQMRKAEFARTFRACSVGAQLYENAVPNIGDRVPRLDELCPAEPITYFSECTDDFKKSCDYTAVSSSNELACKNSFDECQDSDYLKDKLLYDAVNKQCKRKGKLFDFTQSYGPIIGASVILAVPVVIIIVIFVAVPKQYGGQSIQTLYQNNGGNREFGRSILTSKTFITFGVVFLIAGVILTIIGSIDLFGE